MCSHQTNSKPSILINMFFFCILFFLSQHNHNNREIFQNWCLCARRARACTHTWQTKAKQQTFTFTTVLLASTASRRDTTLSWLWELVFCGGRFKLLSIDVAIWHACYLLAAAATAVDFNHNWMILFHRYFRTASEPACVVRRCEVKKNVFRMKSKSSKCDIRLRVCAACARVLLRFLQCKATHY